MIPQTETELKARGGSKRKSEFNDFFKKHMKERSPHKSDLSRALVPRTYIPSSNISNITFGVLSTQVYMTNWKAGFSVA